MKSSDEEIPNPPPDEQTPLVPQSHGGSLRPFVKGDPRAAAGRRKQVATLAEQRALKRARTNDVRLLLSDLVDAAPRDQLGLVAAAVAQDIIARVANGEIPIRNGDEAATLLRTLVDIARLGAGNATSHVMHASLDPGALLERIEQLQQGAKVPLTAQPSGPFQSDSGGGPEK